MDKPEACDILQCANRLTLVDLLNPADKSAAITDTSDEEIFCAVQEAAEAQENIDLVGGDNRVEAAATHPPTLTTVLEAAAVLQQFLEWDGSESAHQLEDDLCDLSCRLCLECEQAMWPSKITSFFRKKTQVVS